MSEKPPTPAELAAQQSGRDPRAVQLTAQEFGVDEFDILAQPRTVLEAHAALAFALADLRGELRKTLPGRLVDWLVDRLGRMFKHA
jgi:hypothetical protein